MIPRKELLSTARRWQNAERLSRQSNLKYHSPHQPLSSRSHYTPIIVRIIFFFVRVPPEITCSSGTLAPLKAPWGQKGGGGRRGGVHFFGFPCVEMHSNVIILRPGSHSDWLSPFPCQLLRPGRGQKDFRMELFSSNFPFTLLKKNERKVNRLWCRPGSEKTKKQSALKWVIFIKLKGVVFM